jgi:uncharacterized sulfatase
LTNLAGDPSHAQVKTTLMAALDAWLAAQGDPGAPQDTPKAIKAARRGEHLYGVPAVR